MTAFFADSYAIVAYLHGDRRYGARFKGADFRTSILNLMEVHYAQVSAGIPDQDADRRLEPFEPYADGPTWDALRRASQFRRRMHDQGRKCSYIDAAGFTMAKDRGLPFLTGDAAFEGLDGVEFLRDATKRPSSSRRR